MGKRPHGIARQHSRAGLWAVLPAVLLLSGCSLDVFSSGSSSGSSGGSGSPGTVPAASADPIRSATASERIELSKLLALDASNPGEAAQLATVAGSVESAPALRVAALQRLAAGAPERFLEAAEPPISEAVAGQADRSGRFVADNALALAVEAGEGGAALLDRVLAGGSAEARRLGELRTTLEARAGEGGER